MLAEWRNMKSDWFQSDLSGVQRGATDQNVNVLREPYGGLVDLADPRGDGISADNGVSYSCLLERGGDANQSRTFIHGLKRPFPGRQTECNVLHGWYFSRISSR